MKRLFKLMPLLALPLLVGCGDPVENVENRLKAPELMGSWQGEDCRDSDLLGASYRTFLKVNGNSVTQVHQVYSAADCEDPAARLVFNGDLTLESEQAKGRWAVSVLWKESTLTALNDTGRDLLDGADLCGVEEWKVGEAVNMANRDNCPIKPMGREFNVFAGEKDRLLVGELTFREGTRDPDKRPGVTNGAKLKKTENFPE